jgi:hypothetical protein
MDAVDEGGPGVGTNRSPSVDGDSEGGPGLVDDGGGGARELETGAISWDREPGARHPPRSGCAAPPVRDTRSASSYIFHAHQKWP